MAIVTPSASGKMPRNSFRDLRFTAKLLERVGTYAERREMSDIVFRKFNASLWSDYLRQSVDWP
jgi:hypothetical protein